MNNPELWNRINDIVEEVVAAEMPMNKARVKAEFLQRIASIFDKVRGSCGSPSEEETSIVFINNKHIN